MFEENRRTKLLTLALSCLALFIVLLDMTIVNNALPSIQRQLNTSLSGLQWIIDAYTLVFASLLLTTGSLSDRQGRKRWFLVGVVVFTAGSALCGLAPNIGVLVAARALQAVGGAALSPASLSLLTNAFPDPRERAQAIGIWAGVSGLSLSAGPLIGGALVDGPGWRWVFFVNLPVGVVAFIGALRFVRESVNPRPRRLDLAGQLLGVGTLAALVYALIEGGSHGWTSAPILTMFTLTALGLAAFLLVEARKEEPMIELRFFRSAAFSGTNLIAFLTFFSLIGFTFFNTLYFQEIRGYSAFEAGLLGLPATLAIVVMAPLAGRLAGARGPGLPIAVGTAMAGSALLLLLGLRLDTAYSSIWWIFALFGGGLGLVFAPTAASAARSGSPCSAPSSAAASAARSHPRSAPAPAASTAASRRSPRPSAASSARRSSPASMPATCWPSARCWPSPSWPPSAPARRPPRPSPRPRWRRATAAADPSHGSRARARPGRVVHSCVAALVRAGGECQTGGGLERRDRR